MQRPAANRNTARPFSGLGCEQQLMFERPIFLRFVGTLSCACYHYLWTANNERGTLSSRSRACQTIGSCLSFKHQRVNVCFAHDNSQHDGLADQRFHARVLFPVDATVE